MVKTSAQFREAALAEDGIIAQHFYHMWLDNDVSPVHICSDWAAITGEFIAKARRDYHYKAFVAEVGDQIVGSVGGQLFAGLYPLIQEAQHRRYGYVWGVYVEPAYRRRRIATHLTRMIVDYLKTLGCTRVVLHASPSGQPVYERLGFMPSNEMRLDLVHSDSR